MDRLDRRSPRSELPRTTKAELVESLKDTLKEALAFNKDDALNAAGDDFEEMKIAI